MLNNRFIFCTSKIQVIIVVISCVVSTPSTPTILIHILPFGWLNREFRGMLCNYLLSSMWCCRFLLQPMLLWMSHMSTSLSHWLLIFYKPLEDYVWDLTSVGCFMFHVPYIKLPPKHHQHLTTKMPPFLPFPYLMNTQLPNTTQKLCKCTMPF